jgi:hypothetical protein
VRLSSEERFGGCEMPGSGEPEPRHALFAAELCERPLRRRDALADEELLVDVLLARLAQCCEGG